MNWERTQNTNIGNNRHKRLAPIKRGGYISRTCRQARNGMHQLATTVYWHQHN